MHSFVISHFTRRSCVSTSEERNHEQTCVMRPISAIPHGLDSHLVLLDVQLYSTFPIRDLLLLHTRKLSIEHPIVLPKKKIACASTPYLPPCKIRITLVRVRPIVQPSKLKQRKSGSTWIPQILVETHRTGQTLVQGHRVVRRSRVFQLARCHSSREGMRPAEPYLRSRWS